MARRKIVSKARKLYQYFMVFMIVRYIEKKQVGSLNDLFKPFCVFHSLLEWTKGLESHGKGVNLKFIRFRFLSLKIGSDLPSTQVTQPRQEKALQRLPRVHLFQEAMGSCLS